MQESTATSRREPHLWFPQTKLHPPLPGADTLLRPRLLASVRAAILAHRLTLIAAPARAGETTTRAALLREASDLTIVWLTLDADDNDPATFVAAGWRSRSSLTCRTSALARRTPAPLSQLAGGTGIATITYNPGTVRTHPHPLCDVVVTRMMKKERAMQEQIMGQLVQQLQARAGLDQEKATQVANVVIEFLQQHSGDIMKMVTEGGGGDLMGQVGKLFGR